MLDDILTTTINNGNCPVFCLVQFDLALKVGVDQCLKL